MLTFAKPNLIILIVYTDVLEPLRELLLENKIITQESTKQIVKSMPRFMPQSYGELDLNQQ